MFLKHSTLGDAYSDYQRQYNEYMSGMAMLQGMLAAAKTPQETASLNSQIAGLQSKINQFLSQPAPSPPASAAPVNDGTPVSLPAPKSPQTAVTTQDVPAPFVTAYQNVAAGVTTVTTTEAPSSGGSTVDISQPASQSTPTDSPTTIPWGLIIAVGAALLS